MALLGPKTKPVVGIDISSTAVKLVELSRSKDSYRIESYGVQPLPANAVVEKLIKDTDAVSDALRRLLTKTKSKARHVAVAVPGSAVITKIIDMDADLLEFEVENQLEIEAGQYIPYAIDEVNLDFTILGPSEENSEKMKVLLAASQTEVIDQLVEVIETSGFKPAIVDVEAYCMQRAFQTFFVNDLSSEVTPEQAIALVDIGATTTTLYIFQGGEIVYLRDQLFGGLQLTEEIQRRYGISQEEAGLAKKQGGLPPDYEVEVLIPFKEALVQQIERALQFFYSASTTSQVDMVLLSGGTALMEGLQEQVQESLGIITAVPNPFKDISVASRVNKSRLISDSTSLSIALGLALRSFD